MKKSKKVQMSRLAIESAEGGEGVLENARGRQTRARPRSHQRINDTISGSIERKALDWLVKRIPAWVMPDYLTALGLGSSVLIFVSYILTNRNPAFLWLASLGFILNWFGDSLDGNLARYRHVERPLYGYFLDHSLDAISEVLVFLGVGLSPYVHFQVAALALICYMLMSVHVFLSTYVMGEFRLSFFSFGPTEARVIAITANTILFFVGKPVVQILGLTLTAYDVIVILLSIGLLFSFFYYTVRSCKALLKIEKKMK